jgi:hypothetical protein
MPKECWAKCSRATKKLWEETYNQDYIVDGGMYRCEPPSVYYNAPFWQLVIRCVPVRFAEYDVQKLAVITTEKSVCVGFIGVWSGNYDE